jgi:hypothetical protein
MDLSASQKVQNQCQDDGHMAKRLCLYCGYADYFKNECPALTANDSRKVYLTAAEISITLTNPTPTSKPSSGKEYSINVLLALLVDLPLPLLSYHLRKRFMYRQALCQINKKMK